MNGFERLERRYGRLSFPGLLRYYAMLHVLVFALQLIRPDLGPLFEFDRAKIFSGEVWRVVTLFFSTSEFGNPRSPVTLLFLVFAVNFTFMVSDGLESVWGSFKTTLFLYAGIGLILVMNFIYPVSIPSSGTALYASAFLAYATLFPKFEILLFFVLPVQIRFLGMLAAGAVVLEAIRFPVLIPFFLAAYANYAIWAGIPALRGNTQILAAVQRKKRFNSANLDDGEAFHTCAVCHRNDRKDPELEFRIGKDGQEYCTLHLPE
jgi:hypothetical protein